MSRKSSTLEKLGVKVFHVCTFTRLYLAPVTDAPFRVYQYEDLGLIQGIKDLTGDKIVHVFNAMEGHNIQHGITKILQKVRKPRRIVVLSPPFLKEEMVHLFGMVIPITSSSSPFPNLTIDQHPLGDSDRCITHLRFWSWGQRPRRRRQKCVSCILTEGSDHDTRRKAEAPRIEVQWRVGES